MDISFIPKEEFERIYSSSLPKTARLELIAEMCRFNTFVEVKKAGSGHLGSSLSAMDIVVKLYYDWMNVKDVGIKDPNRDIYFSSKGHDVPGLYAVLYTLGIISEEKLLKLRRLGGLDGHPDIRNPGCEINSGSLGMGISKGKGMAVAKRLKSLGGRIYILVGDGEFQEGQNFEAMQSAIQQQIYNITVIMDHNKLQSDRFVDKIVSLGNLEKKIESFGWHVGRCDGHNYEDLTKILHEFEAIKDKPKFLICDTIKGKGVSFMEHPKALVDNNGFYKWHSGAPDNQSFKLGYDEILTRLEKTFAKLKLGDLKLKHAAEIDFDRVRLKDVAERVVVAFGEELIRIAKERKDLIVLDADLSGDCGLLQFEKEFPDRFIECGIAEQDMVSMAGGLALQGLLPIVNSFGVFLASRSNEQIYTNSTERTRIIYVCHYAGLIPAGPGNSHQSMRDVSLFGALYNFIIIEPCNNQETKQVLDWCVNESENNCMIRLAISPSPRQIIIDEYKLEYGKGSLLHEGNDALLIGYGPVMLNEALTAAEILKEENFGLKVFDLPWLNKVDLDWFKEITEGYNNVFIIENHSPYGALGDIILNLINENELNIKVIKLAVEGMPECGTPKEVLKFHELDGASIAKRIKELK
jgi:transketolase